MSTYDWLDSEFNDSLVSRTGFTQLIATKPCTIPSAEYFRAKKGCKSFMISRIVAYICSDVL